MAYEDKRKEWALRHKFGKYAMNHDGLCKACGAPLTAEEILDCKGYCSICFMEFTEDTQDQTGETDSYPSETETEGDR